MPDVLHRVIKEDYSTMDSKSKVTVCLLLFLYLFLVFFLHISSNFMREENGFCLKMILCPIFVSLLCSTKYSMSEGIVS